jgi:hypothetical protein
VSAALVSTLRARPGVLSIGDSSATDVITFRAQVPEVWDAVRIQAPTTATVLETKRRALAELLPNESDVEAYVVKVRGHEVLDESAPLQRAGVRDGSTLLITSRRRRPVK